ncbi:asparagine synthetase B [Methanosarcina sp. MSH10X1]|uniref:asparagine synthetase B family protein n=1 Tax=Methanosarcina sp. MSH10X1 TaxID=2507075 RepID=UPI000FFB34B4|nr:asparagine synthetase B [Methanosarcina sp. MSH10X1]RXA21705.1 asparagine synthetase B [Methanosarcina sp. MSH10X1]
MCGIAGAVGTPDTNNEVKRMLAALGHRGPDVCGTYLAEGLSIGNTLLKITGDMPQPLAGKGALVLNGEIFNFRELAAEKGIKTESDTEVLFTLIETRIKEGDSPINAVFSALSRVNGDYALAYILDGELVLARDPVGVKPLFYFVKRNTKKPEIIFASEKKAFSSQKDDIKPFPPGSIKSFNIRSGAVKEKSLEIKLPQKRLTQEREAVSLLKAALERAVEIRLTKTAGIAFSGGIDSVFLAALAKNIDPSIPLYAVGLPNSHDLAQAERAAEAIGLTASLKIRFLSPGEIEAAIPDVIYSTESIDPMKISIGLPLYFVAKAAKEEGKRVLLTGQGADELFGGYSRHESFLEEGPEVLDSEIYSDLRKISTINLERDDMVTMANSVELRVPFLDREVIRTGLAIHPELKVLKRDNLYIRKYILRKAAEGMLPPELLWKEKKAIQYGTGVQKVLDRFAREAGFSKREGNHIERYLKQVATDQGFDFIIR